MYQLHFSPDVIKTWSRLERSVQQRFAKMLDKRCHNPRIPGTEVKGLGPNLYRLKLLKEGLRLIYEVDDEHELIKVIAVGRRDKNEVYKLMNISD